MNLGLEDKVCIVLGSSRGIGKGIACVLAQEGARVVLTGRNQQDLAATFSELEANFAGRVLQQVGDLNLECVREAVCQNTLQRWGRIDALICNAGAVKPVPDWDISEEDWSWYFDSNLHVLRRCATHFIPQLKATKGVILFVGSIAGVEDIGAPSPYSAAKAALSMYAKSLARKLAAYSIRVNTIAPGNILFPAGAWERKIKADAEAVQSMLEQKVPLRRFGTAEEVGSLAAFLISERASFVTGSCFVIDGGQTT